MSTSPRLLARKKVPYADTLSVLLPSQEQTYLLKVCLHPGVSGKLAWEAWQDLVGDVLTGLKCKGGRSLIPLLANALSTYELEVDPSVRSYLNRVVFYEELRALAYQQILHEIVAIFSARDINFLVLKGAALSASVFTDLTLRHNHDIDLLLHQCDLENGTSLLEANGFTRVYIRNGQPTRSVKFTHKNGLPVSLHLDLFKIPYYQAPLEAIWERHSTVTSNDMSLQTLAVSDALLHVCGQAACSGSRDSLIWVADAWHIVRVGRVDWDSFLETALSCRLALPLGIQLAFLKDELQMQVPENVIDSLIFSSQESPRLAQEAALLGARSGSQGSIRNLLMRTSAWQAKVTLLKNLLFPSRDFMRWTVDFRRGWPLPLLYLARWIRFFHRNLHRHIWLLLQRFNRHQTQSIPNRKRRET